MTLNRRKVMWQVSAEYNFVRTNSDQSARRIPLTNSSPCNHLQHKPWLRRGNNCLCSVSKPEFTTLLAVWHRPNIIRTGKYEPHKRKDWQTTNRSIPGHFSFSSFWELHSKLTSCSLPFSLPTTSKSIGKGPAMNADQLDTEKAKRPCTTVTRRQFHSGLRWG